MDLVKDWLEIRKHFNKSFRSNFYVSIASVDKDNHPTITPIGSLFLNRNRTGFYFEKYLTKLPQHAQYNNKICVLAVNSNTWFWVKSLFKGRFNSYPAIKLYGELGERREASEIEITRLQRRMKATQGTKGNKYLWGDMQFVRDVKFTKAEK
ncbi:MAG: pyridoxamine 5'-phosphate oxidase family protein [Cyclobacteriaceae bacterium]|nr:pyridoxamine 5'-phosphate oxidase family protein [Cyclobacteriaceae bacterium]